MSETSSLTLTVELSLYPLTEDYLPPIKGFIAWLQEAPDVHVEYDATATIVHGEYHAVYALLERTMREAHERFGPVVFVSKFIPGHTLK